MKYLDKSFSSRPASKEYRDGWSLAFGQGTRWRPRNPVAAQSQEEVGASQTGEGCRVSPVGTPKRKANPSTDPFLANSYPRFASSKRGPDLPRAGSIREATSGDIIKALTRAPKRKAKKR